MDQADGAARDGVMAALKPTVFCGGKRSATLLATATPPGRHSVIEPAGIPRHTRGMGKSKIPATGEGYLGEVMVHKLTRAVGVVESVFVAQAGWPPQITLKLPDGSVKKGRLSDFRDPSGNERAKLPAA